MLSGITPRRTVSIDEPDAAGLALDAWRAGRLVAVPTETVYGLSGDAENDDAIAAIYAAKGRPSFNPLILHVDSVAMAARYAVIDARAERVMASYWPGPLTIVLPRAENSPASASATAGLPTVALRVPDQPRLCELIAAFGRAIAAPSANRSGRLSPTSAGHVAEEFSGWGEPALILDGGSCPLGVESSIVDLSGETPVLLRPGGVPCETLRKELPTLAAHSSEAPFKPAAPGMLASHYAPSLPVRLNASDRRPGETWLGFAAGNAPVDLDLSPRGDTAEAAANLFAMLRRLDDPARYAAIAVMPVPEAGLGQAINDRLKRAAAPRP